MSVMTLIDLHALRKKHDDILLNILGVLNTSKMHNFVFIIIKWQALKSPTNCLVVIAKHHSGLVLTH